MISKPKFKICRRLGPGVYDKCQTPKFSAASGKFAGPNQKRPKALTEYGTQLIEKQKIRFSYGITERQLANYVKKASLLKGGTVDKFYEELESRLDNVIYRMGLAPTRRAARQMVSHGHFVVNDHKVTIPSYAVRPEDMIKIREGSKSKKLFEGIAERNKEYTSPEWLMFDYGKMEGQIKGKPVRNETFIDLNAVLEFYSR